MDLCHPAAASDARLRGGVSLCEGHWEESAEAIEAKPLDIPTCMEQCEESLYRLCSAVYHRVFCFSFRTLVTKVLRPQRESEITNVFFARYKGFAFFFFLL